MQVVTLDMETHYSRDYSLTKLTTEAYIRDPRFEVIGVSVKVGDYPVDWFSGSMEETKRWLNAIPWHDKALAAHHCAFDGAILKWHFDIEPGFYLDTLSMARPKHNLTTGCSLKALAEAYGIGQKGTAVLNALGKRRADFTPAVLADYGEYCKNDTALTYQLYNILKEGFPEAELEIIDLVLRMFIDPVLVLDKPLLENHLVTVKDNKKNLLRVALTEAAKHNPEVVRQVAAARLEGKTITDILMSNPLFAELLKVTGVEPPTKVSARTGQTAWAFAKTDEEFKALLEHENPAVQTLVAARLGVKSTLEETRTEAFIGVAERGLLPILLNYSGAHTHRLSGGDKLNLQNLTRRGVLRQSLQAPDGHDIIACDSSQIEARVLAWFAGQDDLVEDFRNGVDIYSNFATDVYGRPVDRKRKAVHPETGEEYNPDEAPGFVGKTSVLGLGFSMGGPKFQVTLKKGMGGMSVDMPLDNCWDVVNLYRRKYPEIPKLWDAAQKMLFHMEQGGEGNIGVGTRLWYMPGSVLLPNGLRISYPELHRDGKELSYAVRRGRSTEKVYIYGGKCVENLVQALARIVVFEQMLLIHKAAQKLKARYGGIWRVVLTVHDEVVAVVPTKYAAQFQALMEKIMSTTPAWAGTLPVACEAGRGRTYGSAH